MPCWIHRSVAVLPILLAACSAAPNGRPGDTRQAHRPAATPASPAGAETISSDADSNGATAPQADTGDPEPYCGQIDDAYQVFMARAAQGRQREAYEAFEAAVRPFEDDLVCTAPRLEKQIRSRVALIEAALELKDPERCFGEDSLVALSDLARRIRGTDHLDHAVTVMWEDALESISRVYRKCVDLEGGEAAATHRVSTIEEILGDPFFWREAMFRRRSVRPLFSRPPCPIKAWPDAVELAKVGGRGCLRLEPPTDDQEPRSCPRMFWRNNDAVVEIRIDTDLGDDGCYRSELLRPEDCCNLMTTDLSVRRHRNEIQVHLTSDGQDCFGGTAHWLKEEIYRLDLKNKRMALIEEIPIWG